MFASGEQFMTVPRGPAPSMYRMEEDKPLKDLDFTQVFRVRDVVPAAAPVRTEPQVRDDTRIGERGADKEDSLITYVRPGRKRAPVAADAPVLVVEDDEITRQLLEHVMKMFGLPVRSAADAGQMQQQLRKPPLPRLILLDVELPRVNGFRILEVLRKHPQTSAIAIVMVTSCAGSDDIQQGLSLGADGYLSKPVTVRTLRAVVQKVLACKP
jgi:CheY-like chemotaxis protein